MWSVSPTSPAPGSRDGHGAGDHDRPYQFGWKPRVSATYPFSQRQFARLLLLRSRYQAGRPRPTETKHEHRAA